MKQQHPTRPFAIYEGDYKVCPGRASELLSKLEAIRRAARAKKRSTEADLRVLA